MADEFEIRELLAFSLARRPGVTLFHDAGRETRLIASRDVGAVKGPFGFQEGAANLVESFRRSLEGHRPGNGARFPGPPNEADGANGAHAVFALVDGFPVRFLLSWSHTRAGWVLTADTWLAEK